MPADARQLQNYFRQSTDATRITRFRDITSGWQTTVYAFTLETGSGPRDLVLRLYPGSHAAENAQREFDGIRQLHAAGFPVPDVVAVETDPVWFGQPFIIMDWVAGDTLAQRLNTAALADVERLERQFCALFARLHRLDWQPFIHDTTQRAAANAVNQHLLTRYRDLVDRSGMTGAHRILDWIAARPQALQCDRPSVVHMDFHAGNVLCQGDEMIVIDWTDIAVWDFRADLAWTLLLTGIHQGAMSRDRLLAYYTEAAGAAVHNIEVFEAFGCVRRLNDLWGSWHHGAEASGLLPEARAAMQRETAQYQHIQSRLQAITGSRIAEIDDLLHTLE